MERKTFTTTIDESVQNKFKAKCAENGIKMNELLEIFMQMYSDEKFELALKLSNKPTIVEK